MCNLQMSCIFANTFLTIIKKNYKRITTRNVCRYIKNVICLTNVFIDVRQWRRGKCCLVGERGER